MSDACVIVLGSINVDLVITSKRLPSPGETVTGGTFFQASGGKGANQAVAAARAASDPVRFLAAVGTDDLGRSAVAALSEEQLDLTFLKQTGEPTGTALILVGGSGENMISVAAGANGSLTPTDVDAVPDDAFRSASVFLASLEVPLETVAAGVRKAKRCGLTTILNPAPATEELSDVDWLADVDWLTPNETELALLSRRPTTTEAECRTAAEALLDSEVGRVIVTRGGAGVLLVTAADVTSLPATRVVARDTTAAGDAFNGVFAVGLSEGLDPEDAARRAVVAAGISVTRLGAQPSLPTRNEIDAASTS